MIWGIDCSSKKINIAGLDSSGKIAMREEFSSTTKDMDIRFCELGREFKSFCRNYVLYKEAPSFSVIENSIFVQNLKATNGITSVIALVKFVLFYYGISFLGIDNHSWKKVILGDGRAEKEKIMAFAKARWGDEIINQDFADASCIALWGLKRFNNDI